MMEFLWGISLLGFFLGCVFLHQEIEHVERELYWQETEEYPHLALIFTNW